MHVLIDVTNMRPLARHESYIALAALAYVQFANCDCLITRLGATRGFAVYSAELLHGIARSTGMTIPAGVPYPSLAALVRAQVEKMPGLDLLLDVDTLRAQACAIDKSDTRPHAINRDGGTPAVLSTWLSEPQRNRRRDEDQHWINFTTDRADTGSRQLSLDTLRSRRGDGKVAERNSPQQNQPEETHMPADKSDKKKPAAKPAPAKKVAPKPAPAPAPKDKAAPAAKAAPAPEVKAAAKEKAAPVAKVERVAANGVVLPKDGTVGGRIFAECDRQLAASTTKPKTPPKLADVLTALSAEAELSVRKGFHQWAQFHGLQQRKKAAPAS